MKKLLIIIAFIISSFTGSSQSQAVDAFLVRDSIQVPTAMNPLFAINLQQMIDSLGSGSGMIYPSVGLAYSTGSTWGTSIDSANIPFLDTKNTFDLLQTFTSGAIFNDDIDIQKSVAGGSVTSLIYNTSSTANSYAQQIIKTINGDAVTVLNAGVGNDWVYGMDKTDRSFKWAFNSDGLLETTTKMTLDSTGRLGLIDSMSITKDSYGAMAILTNGELKPTYIEFKQSDKKVRGSVGALGRFEMNMSYNMDYADAVHRYYDPVYSANWFTINNLGLYYQYAPSGYAGGDDIWTNQGSLINWGIDTLGNELLRGNLTIGDSTSGDNDYYHYFATDGSYTTEYLKWDDGNSEFQFSNDVVIDSAFTVIDGNVMFGSADSALSLLHLKGSDTTSFLTIERNGFDAALSIAMIVLKSDAKTIGDGTVVNSILQNDASEEVIYASTRTNILDDTDGTEDGSTRFQIMVDGTLSTQLLIDSTITVTNDLYVGGKGVFEDSLRVDGDGFIKGDLDILGDFSLTGASNKTISLASSTSWRYDITTISDDFIISDFSGKKLIALRYNGNAPKVELYYDDAKKLETLTGGVGITGDLSATGTAIDFVTSGAVLTVGVGADNGTVSAGIFTDRTKYYDGDALSEIKNIKGKDGEIEHYTLPPFARTFISRTDTLGVETIEEGRDLGAMVSILTKGMQQLMAQNDSLLIRIKDLEKK